MAGSKHGSKAQINFCENNKFSVQEEKDGLRLILRTVAVVVVFLIVLQVK